MLLNGDDKVLKKKDFILQQNVQCDSFYSLCLATWESIEHIFPYCPFTNNVWRFTLRLFNLQPITCVLPIEMVEPILLRVNQNDKAMITLGKLIS